MKQSSSVCGRGSAKARRKTREELNQEARDRKREKKHSGHAPGSTERNNKVGRGVPYKDPRIGSKKPVPLGVSGVSARQSVQETREKKRLSPEAELDMLESDDRLDALLERLENGETLSAEEQQWVDEKLDRINALIQQLGLSFDDEENDEEREDDLMRLLKGGK